MFIYKLYPLKKPKYKSNYEQHYAKEYQCTF